MQEHKALSSLDLPNIQPQHRCAEQCSLKQHEPTISQPQRGQSSPLFQLRPGPLLCWPGTNWRAPCHLTARDVPLHWLRTIYDGLLPEKFCCRSVKRKLNVCCKTERLLGSYSWKPLFQLPRLLPDGLLACSKLNHTHFSP